MAVAQTSTPTKKRRTWRWVGVVALALVLGGTVTARWMIARAEPILRERIIDSLATRFQSRVELQGFHVSVAHGIEVYGEGLKIFGKSDPNAYEPGEQALIEIREFRFGSALRSLFRSPMHVDTVYVKGLDLNVPPKGRRQEMTRMGSRTKSASIFVDKFVCQQTRLVINSANAEKAPLEFDISQLSLKDIGPGAPLRFDATLINPKPVGNIQSTGLFGPLEQDAPGDTPVQGDYSFRDADLGTIKGIAGILSSTGQYSGTLNNIAVHGQTDTPDFRVASSGHAVPLHTEFHATVDGTSGDTYLRPVEATFLHTSFTATGSVVREKGKKGHDITLDVVLDRAWIEDLLRLGVRTDPPVMSGPLEMKTTLNLRPGEKSVADRLKLAGNFRVLRAHFTNAKVQSRLDSLSLRSRGKPREAKEVSGENVPVDLRGVFVLNDGLLSFSLLHFQMPGTHLDMTGSYGLDGRQFDFRGTARLDAKLSQMTTGWKSILLKPVDPFFHKKGAGTQVPVKITGTQGSPRFGLDFGHKDEPARNHR